MTGTKSSHLHQRGSTRADAEVENDEAGTQEPHESAEPSLGSDEGPQGPAAGDDEAQAKAAPKAKAAKAVVPITFERYTQIQTMIVSYLRRREQSFSGNLEDAGLKRSEIVDWILGEATDLQGEEELKGEARLVRSVIKNMKDKDNILIEVSQEASEKERKLAVHPNIES